MSPSPRVVTSRSLVVGDETIVFDIVRVRGRRSAHIHVSRDGVEVRVPYHCAYPIAERQLLDHLDWVQAERARIQKDTARGRASLVHGATLPYLGKTLMLVRGEQRRPRVRQLGSCLLVARSRQSDLARDLEQWFRRQARSHFAARIHALAPLFGGRLPRMLSVRGQKTRWGSCSGEGNISLNWRMMQLDACLVDYVLAHELCHLTHMDHSSAFWSLLGDGMPDYAVFRCALAEVGELPL